MLDAVKPLPLPSPNPAATFWLKARQENKHFILAKLGGERGLGWGGGWGGAKKMRHSFTLALSVKFQYPVGQRQIPKMLW